MVDDRGIGTVSSMGGEKLSRRRSVHMYASEPTDHTLLAEWSALRTRGLYRELRDRVHFADREPPAMGSIGRPAYLAPSICIHTHTRKRDRARVHTECPETVRPKLTKVFYESYRQENTTVGRTKMRSLSLSLSRAVNIRQRFYNSQSTRSKQSHACYRTPGQGHTHIDAMHTEADLRRSNYGDTHVMCVPTGVGKYGEFTVAPPRCSPFTDTDPISINRATRGPGSMGRCIFDAPNAPRTHAAELRHGRFRATKFRPANRGYFRPSVPFPANPGAHLVSSTAVCRHPGYASALCARVILREP